MSVEELAVLEADKACLRDKLALAIIRLKESRRKGAIQDGLAKSQQARIDRQSGRLVSRDTLVGRLTKELKVRGVLCLTIGAASARSSCWWIV